MTVSVSAEAASPPAVRRDQSIAARRAARRKRAERERRIVGLLNDGHSVAEIAAREGLTQRRMRAVV
jgi:DNA-binding CsgD family transcriptional regulator